MDEVIRMSLPMLSKCTSRRYACSPNAWRTGIMMVITIAMPEKIAPATK